MALLTQTQAMAHVPHPEATAMVNKGGGREGALGHGDVQAFPLLNTLLLTQRVL